MINVIFGLVFIVGGFTGDFVLMGTDSPEALMAVGAGLVVLGFVQMNKKG